MEIILKISEKAYGERILRVCVFSFLFFLLSTQVSFSQTPDSASAVITEPSASVGEPSMKNLSKNMEEIQNAQEKLRFDEIMSYIYMGVGFSIVIAIAWFTTVLARKRKKKEDEVRAVRMQQVKHRPSHHHPRR